MNALSATPDGTVHDYVDGLADLAARRVRFIGDPAKRIAEDYLRILRFFRFHAAYGHGHLDPDGLHAVIVARDGLDRLSRERVRMEVLKLLVAKGAVPTLVVMAETGLLVSLLGAVPQLASFANMTKVEAAIGVQSDPLRRLGALGTFLVEDAERLWQRLRLSNAEHDRLASLAEGWWRITALLSEQGARALLYRLGPERYVDRVLLAWSRSLEGAADPKWRALATLAEQWIIPVSPFKAADFMQRGLAKGPQIGIAMRRAEEMWIAADFPTDAAALEQIIEQASRGPVR